MPDRKPITSFFCWMVATILLAVSMGVRSVPATAYDGAALTVEQIGQDLAADHQEPASEPTIVSALSLDAVVISLFSYHFSPYFLPAPQLAVRFADRSRATLPARFSEPLFFFCYFHKVFGKQIAANAP